MSMSLLYWGAQSWTQHSRCALTSAEGRGRIRSCSLLATLILMQPRVVLAFFEARARCWLVFNFVSRKSFSAKLLSSWLPSAHTGAWGYSQAQGFALTLVELHEVPVDPFLPPVEVASDGSTTL